MSAVQNFTVQNNALFDNTSFIGSHGPNCSQSDNVPSPQPFVASQDSIVQCNLQSNFTIVPDATSLTCLVPSTGPYWPFGSEPTPIVPGESVGSGSRPNKGAKIGWSLCISLGLIAALIGT